MGHGSLTIVFVKRELGSSMVERRKGGGDVRKRGSINDKGTVHFLFLFLSCAFKARL